MLTVGNIVEEIYMITVCGQSDGGCFPGFHQGPDNLIGIFACSKALASSGQFQLYILIYACRSGISVVAIDIEDDGSTGLQGLTEVDTEARPAVVCVAQLQSITAAVCRSSYTGCGIGHSFESDITTGIALSDQQVFLAGILKVDTFGNVTDRLGGFGLGGFGFGSFGFGGFRFGSFRLSSFGFGYIRCFKIIQQQPGGNRTVLTVGNIVEEVYMITVCGQSDGGCIPGFHQSPDNLIGIFACSKILARSGQFQLHILVYTRRSGISIVAIDIEGDGSAGLQGLTEVDTEARPAVVCVAQFQSIAAAVSGSSDTGCGIGHSFESDITAGIALSHKQLFLADLFKVNALHKVNSRFFRLCGFFRFNRLEVIHHQPGGNFTVLTVGHIVEEIHMITVCGQGDGGCIPGFHQSPYDLIGIFACRKGLAASGQLQLYILSALLGIVVSVDIKGDGSTGLQGLAEVHTERGPAMVCMAQLQGIAAAVYRSSDTCVSIGYSFKCDIATGIALSNQQVFLAGIFKVNTLGNVTDRLRNFRLGSFRLGSFGFGSFRLGVLCCFKVIQQEPGGNFTVLTVGHIVEKVQMVAIGSQRNSNLFIPGFHQCPDHLIGIFACSKVLAIPRQFQLYILVCALRSCIIVVTVEIKGDSGACLQGLAKVHTEGGPAMVCMAQL